MRFLKLYLIGYFVLLIGAAWALWESGILSEIPGVWHAVCYGTDRMPAVHRLVPLLLLVVTLAGGACHEEGDIRIASLDFTGVEQVDEDALENALQTREGSWLPWGRKRYFDRRAFEADLKRIEAFYRDRGFPDARVTAFDVALNSAQDEVSITVNISEGAPIRVAAVELVGFDVLSDDDREMLLETMLLRPGVPMDRQRVLAARERALNELRDNGYRTPRWRLPNTRRGQRGGASFFTRRRARWRASVRSRSTASRVARRL